MSLHPLAGKPAPRELLVDVPQLVSAYYTELPDPAVAAERVSFGTSGHRGSSLKRGFNERHIHAVTQAICEHRKAAGIEGPLFLGRDTHALSEPAFRSALEVLAGNGVTVMIDRAGGYTPTPVISRAIIRHNAAEGARADGVVITPSHNPPEDGGFKYNPPHGGPAGGDITSVVQARANELMAAPEGIRKLTFKAALGAESTHPVDYVGPYVEELAQVLDMQAIAGAGLKLGVDPLGGAAVAYWAPIAERYGLDLTITAPDVDPTFGFMCVDKDGKIRMDCSSPSAMAGLIALKDRFDVAFGNDCDVDRHGIVTKLSLIHI